MKRFFTPARCWTLCALLSSTAVAACDGDDSGPSAPELPAVAGTYDIVQPRPGGTCAVRQFGAVTLVVTQDGEEIEINQTEPVPFIPYVGTLERDGDFVVTIARASAVGPGIEVESSVNGRFSGRNISATEVLTFFDVGADQDTRDFVGFEGSQTSCTHILNWSGSRR